MIVVKAPLRIGLFGGGSDMPAFLQMAKEGCVVNATIDKYVYVMVKKRYDDMIYLKYSKNEIVDSVDKIKHDFIRETLKFLGIDFGLEIINWADIPTRGSGLGSSSSFLVALLLALHVLKGDDASKETLAREACYIECTKCNKPIGYQDQYAAAYGGANKILFSLNEDDLRISTEVVPVNYRKTNGRSISKNLILWFTGITRDSGHILKQQTNNYSEEHILNNMKLNVDLAKRLAIKMDDKDFSSFGISLSNNWDLKKTFSPGISNDYIDGLYSAALRSGAKGGKITGAGGGGFLLLYTKECNRAAVIERLSYYSENVNESKEMPFEIDKFGARVLLNIESETW